MIVWSGCPGRRADVVLRLDGEEEEDDHHHDRRDRVEDLDRQVVARLHRDLGLAAAAVADHGVDDQAPDQDADDDRGEPGPHPQVVDALRLHGARRRHREPLELVLALGRAPAEREHRDTEDGAQRRVTEALAEMRSHERDLFRHAQQTHTDVTPKPYYWARVTTGAGPRQVREYVSACGTRSGVPRQRLVRAAAPGRPGGVRGGARHGVRRPAPAARPGPQRATGARQRPGRRGGVPRRAPRRGDVHAERHPRGAPRSARPARRAPPRRGPDGRALGGRALGGAARGGLVAGTARPACGWTRPAGSTLGAVAEAALASTAGAGVLAVQTANHEVGHRPAGGRGGRGGPGRAALRRRLRVAGPAPAARRLVGRGRLGAQVGRPGRGRRAAGAQGRPVAQPVPGRRPRRRAHDRLRERAGRARRGCGAAGRGRGGRARPTAASTRWWTGSARPLRGVPDTEVVGAPERAAPPPGDLLLPLRRR